MEMKVENRGKIFFLWKKINKHTFFLMKIKMMDLSTQIEGIKLIFVMNCSALHFFRFASRMPQIAHILVSTCKIFRRGGREGEGMPLDPLQISSLFFVSNSRL